MLYQSLTHHLSQQSGVKSASLQQFAVISDEQTMETTFWHQLDDQTSETISGGAKEKPVGELTWSIRFGDVTRVPK